jgi:hypothetical protein
MLDTHKSHIKIVTYDNEHGVVALQITSNLGNITNLVVDAYSFTAWAERDLIQRCFPEFDLVTRELMISGMDPEMQAEIFG